jgi:hypothetical protein
MSRHGTTKFSYLASYIPLVRGCCCCICTQSAERDTWRYLVRSCLSPPAVCALHGTRHDAAESQGSIGAVAERVANAAPGQKNGDLHTRT